MKNQRGSALIETVIVLPLFAFMVYMVMVIGEMSLAKCKIQSAVRYAAFKRGEQSASQLKNFFFAAGEYSDRGSFQDVEFNSEIVDSEDQPTLTQSSEHSGGEPEWREWAVPYDMDEMDNALRNVGIRVTGRYVYDPNANPPRIVYEQEETLTGAGNYFEDNNVFDETPDVLAALLNSGITASRSQTRAEYKTNPGIKLPSSFSRMRDPSESEAFNAGTVENGRFAITLYQAGQPRTDTPPRAFERIREVNNTDEPLEEGPSVDFFCETVIASDFDKGGYIIYQGLEAAEAGEADSLLEHDTEPALTTPEGNSEFTPFDEFPAETDDSASDYWEGN